MISGTPATTVVAGSVYTFTPVASDPQGRALTFTIYNRPAWATFSQATGRLQGTPQIANVGTYGNIIIAVSNGRRTAQLAPFSIVVTTPASNSAPVISGVPAASVTAGSAYAFVPTASDADNNPLTFSISGRPAWATFDTQTGRLAGTPPAGTTGVFGNIVIGVSDGVASAALPAFSITVNAPPPTNTPPTISGTPPTTATVGTLYAFTPSASDANGDTLTFSIVNKPTWASFSASTGALQGTPSAAGTYGNIVISVSDGQSSRQLSAFAITVNPKPNTAPTISGVPPTSARPGTAYAFQPTAADANGDPLTFTITNRPAWATFSASTGALVGTPTSTSVGTFGNIVISVSDGALSASLPAFAITVAAVNTPPTISGTPPATATVGTLYAFTPSASDANGDTLTFSIVNKPAWATFTASTGALQGTPVTAGTYGSIVISVSDAQSSTQLPAFAITVNPKPNTAPTISGIPPTSVMQGTQYAFQPTANDVDGDVLTFSIVNKPAWATFTTSTGRLQGTPGPGDVGTTSGIAITVTDGKASKALAAFNLTVLASANGSATLSWLPPTQNTDGTPLTNLAGYKVYWGPSQGVYPNSVTLNNPGLATYVVGSLVPGTYYFAVSSFNTTGVESSRSNSASKTIP